MMTTTMTLTADCFCVVRIRRSKLNVLVDEDSSRSYLNNDVAVKRR